jgi:uncharacterized repeat protein (TIGR01451 family)
LVASGAASPLSASTPAGTIVTNVANANMALEGVPHTIASNIASVRIDELLDIALATTAANASVSGDAVVATPFLLSNRGNGSEAFILHGVIAGSAVTVIGFAIDVNGNGKFDTNIDIAITNDTATSPLAPGASLALLVLLQGNGVSASNDLTITARALTGSGRPGTIFAGTGDGSCNAVVGLTTAVATLSLPLAFAQASVIPDATVVKSQSVRAPDGGDQPISGAVITYTLEANFAGSGIARGARLADLLPEGTLYIPGSLRLDGAPLTDPDDGDAGAFDGATIRIALGDIVAPAARSFSFQVTIK